MGEKSSYGAKKKLESFSNYVASTLENSMITGIPQIANAGSIIKKIVRSVVFVFCMAGFIYQSLTFLDMYWEYPTILDIKVTNPEITEYPAMTICNLDGYQNSRICSKIKCLTIKDEDKEKYCEKSPRYCVDGKLPDDFQIPTLGFRRILDRLPIEKVEQYMQPLNSLVTICELRQVSNDKMVSECNLTTAKQFRVFRFGAAVCYTLYNLLDQPNGEQPTAFSTAFQIMILNVDAKEYDDVIYMPYMQISFHSHYTTSNPFTDGFTLYPGNGYSFRLSKTVKHLLPAPYPTDCIDYFQKWKDRGGWGPMNVKDCIRECQVNVSLAEYGCVEATIEALHREPLCDMTWGNEFLYRKSMKCAEQCKSPCWELTYAAEKNTLPVTLANKENLPGLKNEVNLRVYYNHMEITDYIYNPKFERIETFSYVGGYVGMWLGISLVAVFDFLETVVAILKYPLRRIRSKYRKRTLQMTRVRSVKIQDI